MAADKKHRIWDVTNVVDPQPQHKIPLGTGGEEAAVTTVERIQKFLGVDIDAQKLYTYQEFLHLPNKQLRLYYVAEDEQGVLKGNLWRVYLKNKPLFEFSKDGNVASVFPTVFPFVFVSNN